MARMREIYISQGTVGNNAVVTDINGLNRTYLGITESTLKRVCLLAENVKYDDTAPIELRYIIPDPWGWALKLRRRNGR